MSSKVEELLERLLCVDKTPLYCSQGECDYAKGKHIPTRTELEELIALARSEGVAEERERIRNLGTLHDKGNGFPFYSVGASVLAPTKESER